MKWLPDLKNPGFWADARWGVVGGLTALLVAQMLGVDLNGDPSKSFWDFFGSWDFFGRPFLVCAMGYFSAIVLRSLIIRFWS